MLVPPFTVPEFGDTLVMLGAGGFVYVNPPGRGALLGQPEGKFVGHGLTTTTSAAPRGLAGVLAVIVEPFSTTILVAFRKKVAACDTDCCTSRQGSVGGRHRAHARKSYRLGIVKFQRRGALVVRIFHHHVHRSRRSARRSYADYKTAAAIDCGRDATEGNRQTRHKITASNRNRISATRRSCIRRQNIHLWRG